MKSDFKSVLTIIFLVVCCFGCSRVSYNQLTYSGFLPEYGNLTRISQGNYMRWISPSAPEMSYWNNVILDEVVLYFNSRGKHRAYNPRELHDLTEKFHNMLGEEISRTQLNLVNNMDSRTLRISIAISDIDPVESSYQNSLRTGTSVVVGVATEIPLAGMLLSADLAGATMEAIFSNAQTGEIYATIVVKKEVTPSGMLPKDFKKYGSVESILRKWAVSIREALDNNV